MERMNFEQIEEDFNCSSSKAKVSLMHRLIKLCGPAAIRTIIRYCCKQLDEINSKIPDNHPDKAKWLNYGRHKELGPATELNIQGDERAYQGDLGISTELEKW